MAKTKAGGKTNQRTRRPGRRLGVKVFGGQKIEPGQIIVRQLGTKFHPGAGVDMGRDFTLFALKSGTIVFKRKKGDQEIQVV